MMDYFFRTIFYSLQKSDNGNIFTYIVFCSLTMIIPSFDRILLECQQVIELHDMYWFSVSSTSSFPWSRLQTVQSL